MTTGNNKITDRLSDPLGESPELTTGIPVDGSVDPTGEYPKRHNWFSSSISQAGRGIKVNDLWMGGSTFGVNFDVPMGTTSVFPFNNANETPSGHSFEIDDTPGNERILIKHHTGAGVELKQDGSVAVVSRTHQVQVVGADHELIVAGQGNMTYDGDLNITVNGNYNLDVGGTVNVTAGSNYNQSVHGTYITETGDTHQTIVRGNMDTKVWGDRLDFGSSEHRIIAKKDITLSAGQDILPQATRAIRLSAEKHITGATGGFMTWSAEDMRIIGRKGKIGGPDFHYYGGLFAGGEDGQGKETVFHGNLVGRALEAWTAKYAKFSEDAHSAHISNYAVVSATADAVSSGALFPTSPSDSRWEIGAHGIMKDYNKPEYKFDWGWGAKEKHSMFASVEQAGATFLNKDPDVAVLMADNWPDSRVPHEPLFGYMGNPVDWWEVWNKTSPYAVRKISIDGDGMLEAKIAKVDTYANYFNYTPKTPEIRSKLRTMDGANESREVTGKDELDAALCIDSLLDENRLSPLYSLPAPPAPYEQKRSGQSVPQPRFGYSLLGNPVERSSKTFLPKNVQATTRTIVADPLYNPDRNGAPLTSGTRLSKSCTLSKFFGAPGSKCSLDMIPILSQRQDLARQYYLHAWMMDGIASAKEFKDYRLQVTEGYYNPSNGIREAFDGSREPAENYYWREPYRKEDGGSTQKSIVRGAIPINHLKYEGRAVVYSLFNSRGKIDYSATFDLSLYIRDTFFFDQLSLDYDITRPDQVMTQQLIVVMPLISKDFTATFEQKVSTYFNRKTLSGSDLIEITD
jgi:hypothetical protein